MSMREGLTLMLWLLGALAMAAISVVWVLGAQDGKVSPFVLVPLMWSVALGAGFVHHLTEAGLLAKYGLGSRSLAGQPMGAMLTQ